MKVVAFNGSPRKNGNTKRALSAVLFELEKSGIQTEMIQLGGRKVFGCLACGACRKNQDKRCVRTDDDMNELIAKMDEADGIIIGSPTYFSNVTTEVKALIDRCGYVSRSNNNDILRGKIGAAVVINRRAGANFVYAAINFFFGIAEMPIATSSYWNSGVAMLEGDVEKDEEGMKVFATLGANMANMVLKLRS